MALVYELKRDINTIKFPTIMNLSSWIKDMYICALCTGEPWDIALTFCNMSRLPPVDAPSHWDFNIWGFKLLRLLPVDMLMLQPVEASTCWGFDLLRLQPVEASTSSVSTFCGSDLLSVEVFDLLKLRSLEALTYWSFDHKSLRHMEATTMWGFDILRIRPCEALPYWSFDLLKLRHMEALTMWGFDILKLWPVEA